LGDVKIAYRTLIGKCDATRLLGRYRCRQEGNSKVNIKEMWTKFDWFNIGFNGRLL
jgi:hypothetical protein